MSELSVEPCTPTAAPPPQRMWDIPELARQWSTSARARLAIRGGVWSIAGYAATQLLRMLATLVLARRILAPEPFGVVGLVGVFLAGIAMFSELGLVANVIQHPRGDDSGFLNTAFSIQAGRGVAIWVIAAVTAYPLAAFYNQPALFPLLLVAALAEVVRGLTSTSVYTLTRHVNLRGVTLLTVASEVGAAAVSIAWAVVSPSAWALVVRTIVSALIYAAGSHFVAKPSVRLGWDREAAKDILHFGGWVSLATATYFLGGQGERLILGKFITAAELGCFSLALMISTAPAAGINQLVGQILLPILSKSVRSGQTEAAQDFLRARKLFCVLAVVAALGFTLLGKPFVAIVLNSKYAMAGWMLQLLGLRVALDVFAAPASTLVMAYGRTKYSAAANAVRLVLMVIGIGLALRFMGLYQAVIALLVAQVLSYLPLIVGIGRLLPETLATESKSYAAFVAVIAVGVAMSALAR